MSAASVDLKNQEDTGRLNDHGLQYDHAIEKDGTREYSKAGESRTSLAEPSGIPSGTTKRPKVTTAAHLESPTATDQSTSSSNVRLVSQKERAPTPAKVAATPLTATETALFQKLIGDWKGYYQGKRQLVAKEDGSGTMVAHPEGFAASLLAAKLTFHIKWTVRGDCLLFETVKGEPADKVNLVLNMYGRKRSHKILELTSDRMVLLDEDGVTQYEWVKVSANEPSK